MARRSNSCGKNKLARGSISKNNANSTGASSLALHSSPRYKTRLEWDSATLDDASDDAIHTFGKASDGNEIVIAYTRSKPAAAGLISCERIRVPPGSECDEQHVPPLWPPVVDRVEYGFPGEREGGRGSVSVDRSSCRQRHSTQQHRNWPAPHVGCERSGCGRQIDVQPRRLLFAFFCVPVQKRCLVEIVIILAVATVCM